MAAIAVVGVAALYKTQNRTIELQPTERERSHPLKGALAKRMGRFNMLAGRDSSYARNNGMIYVSSTRGSSNSSSSGSSDSTDTDSGTVYVNMESSSAGGNMMAMV